MELVDAEDQINENDEGIFDEPLDQPIISDEEIAIVERLEQDLMGIDDSQMERNTRTMERSLSDLIPSGQMISPIASVDTPDYTYIELQATVAQTSTHDPNTRLEENEIATTETQPRQRRRRRTKLEMVAVRALEAGGWIHTQ